MSGFPSGFWLPALAGFALALLSGVASAQFADNTTQIPSGNPFNNSRSENIDFGDVDLDGDWDAVFADGGDLDQDQNRIWINQGLLQAGTLGAFVDGTATRFPAMNDQSRDIEFVDFDNDGDLDLYISDTSQIVNQTNRWWTNMGRRQGGTLGFFADETALRWIGLSGAGSSLAPSQLIGGGFIDFSCDCDFGDLDNDGDLDLVHSSYGGQFGGNVPTRIFLNNGSGSFVEFNPTGFQLTGQNINDGDPGLWCEGNQASDTTDATGVSCDIASTALDIDLGDSDGDLDLDLLHGARQEAPRFFTNRLEENGGSTLGFRDVTGAVFPAGYTSGDGHYEQEFGDMDSDGDWDVYGLNWIVSGFSTLNDITLRNDGTGTFGSQATLPASGADDNEGDFLDYDNDGDLDLYVANFGGFDKLYEGNDTTGGFVLTNGVLPGTGINSIALDADCADVDNDGDTDIFVAVDNGVRNAYLENLTTANDTFAPRLPHLEQAPNRTATVAPTVVRVHVYDNASYYVTWYNRTWLEVRVDAGPAFVFSMSSSGGQIFRGEIPGQLVGSITYTAHSEDAYGNEGISATLGYSATGGFTGEVFCAGSIAACPCGNHGANGAGCENSFSTGGGLLTAIGSPSVSGDTVALILDGGPPTAPTLFFQGTATENGTEGSAFGDGLRCVAGSVVRLGTRTNSAGAASFGAGDGTGDMVSVAGQVPGAGGPRYYQAWYRNNAGFCTSETFNFSNAVHILWGS